MNLLDLVEQEQNKATHIEVDGHSLPVTYTENGALTLATTGNSVVDLFSRVAAMRSQSEKAIVDLFHAAYVENPLFAILVMFQVRDILGGSGERRVFRIMFSHLIKLNAELATMLLPFIPRYGRWDDVLAVGEGSVIQDAAFTLYAQALHADYQSLLKDSNASISLAAKWAPSENAGKKNVKLWRKFHPYTGWNPQTYRVRLSAMRKKLNIVESLMTSKQFNKIDYNKVPGRAAKLYKKAFERNDAARYSKWVAALQKGTAKVNSKTLFPYEILEKARFSYDPVYEAMWSSLPDYPVNGLAVLDTSGSMFGGYWGRAKGSSTPIDIAASLAIYMAQHARNPAFKNKIFTFSDDAKLMTIKDDSLYSAFNSLDTNHWGGSTNIQAVFDSMLSIAVKHEVPAEEMPQILYVLSDMEFNSADADYRNVYAGYGCVRGLTNLQNIDKKYEKAGYTRPKIVFWNVAARNAQSPAAFDERGIAMFAGASPSLFKTALEGDLNPLKAMFNTLLVPNYQQLIDVLMAYYN